MDSSTLQIGNSRSLRACQGRVLLLSQFLQQDWEQESPLWIINSALQLAEATAHLALQEVEAAGIVAVPSSIQTEAIPRDPEACKLRVICLVQRLTAEKHPSDRLPISLLLALAATQLAQSFTSSMLHNSSQ